MKTLKDYAASAVSESRAQQAIIKWWSLKCREFGLAENLLMAFPLQGARSALNGARMKAEGMRRGTPDMFLAVKEGFSSDLWIPSPHAGLWIEMKSKEGRLTEEQCAMQAHLREMGFLCAVCRSTDDAIQTITRYLIPK